MSAETLGDIVTRNYENHPDKEAILYDGRVFTYREFTARAFRLASALYAQGLRRQHRIAILAQNSNAYVETYAAGEVAGYVTVAINYRLAAPEILYILADAAPSVLIFDAEYTDLVAEIKGQIPEIQLLVCIGGGTKAPGWAEDYEDFLQSAPPAPPISPT